MKKEKNPFQDYGSRSNLFVDFNSDGALGDVPDAAGAAMVELVRHTLVNGSVHLDVNVLSDFVGPEIGRQRDGSALPEASGERVPRPSPESMSGRHLF